MASFFWSRDPAPEVSALTGLSVTMVHRRVKDGTLRAVKLGRPVCIPFDAIDGPRTQETPTMATVHRPRGEPAAAEGSFVPRVSAEDLARNNRELIELLGSWQTEGDEQEQRETLAVLRETLGARLMASPRDPLP